MIVFPRRSTFVFLFVVALGSGSLSAQTAEPAPRTLEEALESAERLETERGRLAAELEGVAAQRIASTRRLRRRVRAFYRMRRAGALPLSGGFDALLRHQSRVHHLERLVHRDNRSLERLERRATALTEEVARLAEEEEVARRVADGLSRRQEEQAASLSVLSAMMEDPAAWSGPASGFGVRLSDPVAREAYRLVDERGRLPLPVGGSAQVQDAEREGGGGLDLITSAGVSVRSVGTGRVAYAAPHPAYGNLVIVDHTDGHYTVYGGLGAIGVRASEPVTRGSVLGVVGPQPLFFQVRRGTRSLPAREWLGI